MQLIIRPVADEEDWFEVKHGSLEHGYQTKGKCDGYVGDLQVMNLCRSLFHADKLKGQALVLENPEQNPLQASWFTSLYFFIMYVTDLELLRTDSVNLVTYLYLEVEGKELWDCEAMYASFEDCRRFAAELIDECASAWPGFFESSTAL